jgi:hypothetical protein
MARGLNELEVSSCIRSDGVFVRALSEQTSAHTSATILSTVLVARCESGLESSLEQIASEFCERSIRKSRASQVHSKGCQDSFG